MVEALIAGAKTETRRCIDPQPHPVGQGGYGDVENSEKYPDEWFQWKDGEQTESFTCPYGACGDRLWVKEAWHLPKHHDDKSPTELWEHLAERKQGVTVLYRAKGWKSVAPFPRSEQQYPEDLELPDWTGRIRPAMFMPRWASRIMLEITAIDVQRLQDMTKKDAIAEGVERVDINFAEVNGVPNTEVHIFDPIYKYVLLWNWLNEKRSGGALAWKKNPWVWVVKFKRISHA